MAAMAVECPPQRVSASDARALRAIGIREEPIASRIALPAASMMHTPRLVNNLAVDLVAITDEILRREASLSTSI